MPVLVGTPPAALEEFPLDLPTRLYLGNSGIVLADGSTSDSYGCTWKNTAKDLWGTKPAPREQVGDRNYDHGQWDATRYYGPRMIPISGTVRAPDHATLHAAKQRLFNTMGVSSFLVRGTEPGYDSFAAARQQGEVDWFEDGWAPPHATFSALLFAPDPRLYSSMERSFDLTFPTFTGGLSWPTTWPAVWDVSPTSGFASLLNPGNEAVGVRLEVHGPATTVAVTLAETGQVLYMANPAGGPLLTAGQYLVVDTGTRQVLLNGDANRRAWVYGDWLLLPPADTTTILIAGSGTTTDSHVSGSYRAVRI